MRLVMLDGMFRKFSNTNLSLVHLFECVHYTALMYECAFVGCSPAV
jgi:hypothetical protein